MNEITKIIYNCKQATFLIEKKQIAPLTFAERIKLRIHLSGCSVCKIFQRQSIIINRMVKQMLHQREDGNAKLTDRYKKDLQDQIEKKLNNNL